MKKNTTVRFVILDGINLTNEMEVNQAFWEDFLQLQTKSSLFFPKLEDSFSYGPKA